MKCLIIAAGYATRLYPLTENFPKPLLEVGGKTILDWLIDDLDSSGLIDGYIVVTNHRFAPIFQSWADGRLGRVDVGATSRSARPLPGAAWAPPSYDAEGGTVASTSTRPIRIAIIDDGTSSNETRLGAVKDIELGIRSCAVNDDLLVMAGDNLLSFSLGAFIDYFREKGTCCVMRYYEPDVAKLRKTGVAQIDEDGLILSMEEKPAEPKGHWCCPPFYIYRAEDVPLVSEGIAAGCGTDAPGSFIAWLCGRVPVHAWEMPGPRYDIGNLESYEAVKKIFEK